MRPHLWPQLAIPPLTRAGLATSVQHLATTSHTNRVKKFKESLLRSDTSLNWPIRKFPKAPGQPKIIIIFQCKFALCMISLEDQRELVDRSQKQSAQREMNELFSYNYYIYLWTHNYSQPTNLREKQCVFYVCRWRNEPIMHVPPPHYSKTHTNDRSWATKTRTARSDARIQLPATTALTRPGKVRKHQWA